MHSAQKTSRILFISGRREDALRLSRMLESMPVAIDHVATVRHARAKLHENDYSIILTEANLLDGNWIDVLHLAREHPVEIEVVATSPHADARFWAEALNFGVYDVLAQPFYEPEVRRIVQDACMHREREAHCFAAV